MFHIYRDSEILYNLSLISLPFRLLLSLSFLASVFIFLWFFLVVPLNKKIIELRMTITQEKELLEKYDKTLNTLHYIAEPSIKGDQQLYSILKTLHSFNLNCIKAYFSEDRYKDIYRKRFFHLNIKGNFENLISYFHDFVKLNNLQFKWWKIFLAKNSVVYADLAVKVALNNNKHVE